MNFSEDENIFDANLLQISRTLEKNTWIGSSSIKIKHPGILHISINERIPIATLKGNYSNAIDSKGKILGNTSSFSFNVGRFLFFKALAASLSM